MTRMHLCTAAVLAVSTFACAPEQSTGMDEGCGIERGLVGVASVLADPDDPCWRWVDAVHGRSVRIDAYSGGSGSLWSRKTDADVAVLTTAAHVMSPCWPVVSDQEDRGLEPMCPQTLWNPGDAVGEPVLRIATAEGGPPASKWSAGFALFNPDFPIADLEPLGLRPRNDFGIYAVDSQLRNAFSGVPTGAPAPLVEASPTFHDPLGLSEAVPSWGDPIPGSPVLVVGFPTNRNTSDARLEQASVGIVLDDSEASDTLARLASLGDNEGMIAYDPEAEFLFEGHILPGMSGSGVFTMDGRQVGIVVRASTADPYVQLVRAVRMRFVTHLLDSAIDALPADSRAELRRYLPPLQAPPT